MAKTKISSGTRFHIIEKKTAASVAEKPVTVTDAAGKYGVAKMEKMAQRGKKSK